MECHQATYFFSLGLIVSTSRLVGYRSGLHIVLILNNIIENDFYDLPTSR